MTYNTYANIFADLRSGKLTLSDYDDMLRQDLETLRKERSEVGLVQAKTAPSDL